MSTDAWRRLIVGVALVACAVFARAAIAEGSTVESLLDGALAPSSAPALLGPIEEGGRTGWTCKPEIAAQSRHTGDALLPADHDGR
jgi:hypothetical protein